MLIAKKSYTNLFILLLLFVFSLQAQEKWVQKNTSKNGFTSRRYHTSVEFKNKLWIIGGYTHSAGGDAICSSTDGINWKVEVNKTPWDINADRSVVYDGKIWVIVGIRAEVWSSSDGVNWTLVTSSAPWKYRSSFTSLVYDNKIWVIGGSINNDVRDVWYTTDGINWVLAAYAPWQSRSGHASVVHNNKMWVIGGGRNNDIWSSSDGVNWTLETILPPWTGRYGYTVVLHKGKMWLIGGFLRKNGHIPSNEVWTSRDGANWTLETPPAPFGGRKSHTTTIFQNKIWLIGGEDKSGNKNDVWCLEPNSIKFHIPKVTPTMGPRIELSFPSQQNNLHIVASWETEGTAIICTSDVHSTKETSPIILDTSKISKDVGIYLSCSTKPGTVGAKNITLEISGYDNFPDYILYPSINFGQNKDMSVVKYGASFPVPANSLKFLSDYPKFAIVEETVTADNQSWQIELIDRSPFSFGSGTWMWSFKK